VLALLPACAQAPTAPPPSSPSRIVGETLPAFRRPVLQGGTFDTDGVSGRAMVVDFFADYCRPCQRALPTLEALHRAHPELTVIGVSVDDDADAAMRTIARHHLTFPVVHDRSRVLAGRFRVTELPFTFVVDQRGRVVFAAGPGQPDDAVGRAVRALGAGS